MEEENKSRFKKILSSLSYVGKLFSSAALVILVLIGLFLLYYVITAKIVSKKPGYEPPLSLYTIVSGSMEPNINVYDVIIATKVTNPTDIHVGDVITFKSTSSISKDLTVTHRVIEIKQVNNSYEYVTKGDNNPTADSDTAKFANLIGRVVMRIPELGRIQFFLATKAGWFIVVLLPALGVIIYDIFKLVKLLYSKKSADKIKGDSFTNNNKTMNKDDKDLNETLERLKKSNYMQKLEELKKFEASNTIHNEQIIQNQEKSQ